MVQKYIRGVPDRGEDVISELEKLGGVNKKELSGADDDCVYYIGPKDNIILLASEESINYYIIIDSWVEIKLPKYGFGPFDKVLARDCDDEPWRPELFSYVREFDNYYIYQCIGNKYRQCIPYEGNEDKVGKVD